MKHGWYVTSDIYNVRTLSSKFSHRVTLVFAAFLAGFLGGLIGLSASPPSFIVVEDNHDKLE